MTAVGCKARTTEPTQEAYLVFNVAPAEEFANTAWDFAALPGKSLGAALGHPFAGSLHDLLLVSKAARGCRREGFSENSASTLRQLFKNIFPMKTSDFLTAFAAITLSSAALAADATLDAAAKEPGALVTASGLVYRSLKDGTGDSPKATDKVKVNYRGTFPDGKEFDSSYKRNEPIVFGLNQVIKCWTEGVQRMKVGGKAKLSCPASIAYGERGAGGVIPPNATLLFEVELLGINGK